MIDPPKRRRRFQFSLRTLLIGVTLTGAGSGYVAHQASIVESRRAELDEGYVSLSRRPIDGGDVPVVRRWLGDKSYNEIHLSVSTPDEVFERTVAEFPEALIFRDGLGIEPDGSLKPGH